MSLPWVQRPSPSHAWPCQVGGRACVRRQVRCTLARRRTTKGRPGAATERRPSAATERRPGKAFDLRANDRCRSA